jgi:phosphatidate cytidylyltransferase
VTNPLQTARLTRREKVLKQRIITALVLVTIVLLALFAQETFYWSLLINVAISLAFWEWLRFCKIVDPIHQVVSFLIFFGACFLAQFSYIPFELIVVSACLLWLALIVFTVTDALGFLHQPWCKLGAGVLMISAAGLIVIRLKQLDNGPLWILCFFICVWAADIGAYFVGKRFGKTKLAPTISPGKTVEGLLGGVAFAAVIYVPIMFLNFPLFDAVTLLVTVLVTVLVSVLGDLFESKMKRHVGLKDSSQILPGHGGVLDRIDSLLSGAPFFAFGLMLLGYAS